MSDRNPRVDDLSALLARVDGLRTSLSTDLTLAAAALDAGADELALELVEHERGALEEFRARAVSELGTRGAEPPAPPPEALPSADPAPRRQAHRRVPAAAMPLALAGVAVLVLALLGAVALRPVREPVISPVTAGATLDRLVLSGADADQLRAAALELNAQVSLMMAEGNGDPDSSELALLLLHRSTEMLDASAQREALADVLAQSRALERQLRAAWPVVQRTLAPLPAAPVASAVRERTAESGSQPRPSTQPTSSAQPRSTQQSRPTSTGPPAATSPRATAAASARPAVAASGAADGLGGLR